jgi:hypothetical protein
MLGVVFSAHEQEAVAEFFELFKTPWEPAAANRKYRVVLGTNAECRNIDADLL